MEVSFWYSLCLSRILVSWVSNLELRGCALEVAICGADIEDEAYRSSNDQNKRYVVVVVVVKVLGVPSGQYVLVSSHPSITKTTCSGLPLYWPSHHKNMWCLWLDTGRETKICSHGGLASTEGDQDMLWWCQGQYRGGETKI